MSTWKLARSSKVCALTGRPLEPGSSVVTALFGVEEEVSDDKVRGAGFVRKDFLVDGSTASADRTPEEDAPSAARPTALPAAVEGAIADAYCVWRTKIPADTGPKVPRLDVGMARDLLERIVTENDSARAAAAWTLAMLLVRKRQLTLVRERPASERTAGALVLRWPKTESTFEVPSVVVAEAEMEQLEQDLSRLFEV